MSYQPRVLTEEVLTKLMENQVAADAIIQQNNACISNLLDMLSSLLSSHIPMIGQQFKSMTDANLPMLFNSYNKDNFEVFNGNGPRGKRIQQLILENKLINEVNRKSLPDGVMYGRHPIEIDYENMFVYNPVKLVKEDYDQFRLINFFINALIVFNGIDFEGINSSELSLPEIIRVSSQCETGFYFMKEPSTWRSSREVILIITNTINDIRYYYTIQINNLTYNPNNKIYFTHEAEKLLLENNSSSGNFIFDGLINDVKAKLFEFIVDKLIINDVEGNDLAKDIYNKFKLYPEIKNIQINEKIQFHLFGDRFRIQYTFNPYSFIELSFTVDAETNDVGAFTITGKDIPFTSLSNDEYIILMKSMLKYSLMKLSFLITELEIKKQTEVDNSQSGGCCA